MSLVELMIASAIALFALSVVVSVYSATAQHSTLHLQRAHLHRQLHTALQYIAADIRRSGYWQFDPHTQSPADNPFENATNALRIAAGAGEAADSCILFAYDLDRDGLTGVGRCRGARCARGQDDDNVEQFGFRLRDGAIQSRYGGSEFSCDSGYWQALTDPQIEVTRLQFTAHNECTNLSEPQQPCAELQPQLIRRAVELRLTGRQRLQPDISLNLSTWIRIPNGQLRKPPS